MQHVREGQLREGHTTEQAYGFGPDVQNLTTMSPLQTLRAALWAVWCEAQGSFTVLACAGGQLKGLRCDDGFVATVGSGRDWSGKFLSNQHSGQTSTNGWFEEGRVGSLVCKEEMTAVTFVAR